MNRSKLLCLETVKRGLEIDCPTELKIQSNAKVRAYVKELLEIYVDGVCEEKVNTLFTNFFSDDNIYNKKVDNDFKVFINLLFKTNIATYDLSNELINVREVSMLSGYDDRGKYIEYKEIIFFPGFEKAVRLYKENGCIDMGELNRVAFIFAENINKKYIEGINAFRKLKYLTEYCELLVKLPKPKRY